jgi:hypothetical protein
MLPNFLIIGATKAGTTSLYEYLRAHPQVVMSVPKEPHFFSREENWSRGTEWYERRFARSRGALAVGEASATYSHDPLTKDVPRRIKAVIPDAKLIYLVRHPIERIVSHYVHRTRIGLAPRPIDVMVFDDPIYLSASRYGHQIRQYLHHFDPTRLLVLRSERLKTDRERTFLRVCEFVGVTPATAGIPIDEAFNVTRSREPRARPLVHNLSRVPAIGRLTRKIPVPLKPLVHLTTRRRIVSRPPSVTPKLADRILDDLRADIVWLSEFLGEDLSSWETWPVPDGGD